MQAVVLGFALAADASAVCAAVGASAGRGSVPRLAVAFGLAQGVMALLGAVAGVALGRWFSAVDHWIAAAVLVALGIAALRAHRAEVPPSIGWAAIAALSVATSTDALAGGVALPSFDLPIAVSAAVIAAVTTACCAGAGSAGARLGAHFGRRVTFAGGVALVGLAGWILVTHLTG
jgi:putative Mn2+ efflux pump MntP